MRHDEREKLRRRFQFCCGYCGIHEHDVGAELTVDHFQPQSRGGLHAPENWVYCCHACNEFKGDFWNPDAVRRVLHPLRDSPEQHIVEGDDGVLIALSETGTFHIERLHLNRRQLAAYRRERRLLEDARRTQMKLLEHLKELEKEVQSIIGELERMQRDDE